MSKNHEKKGVLFAVDDEFLMSQYGPKHPIGCQCFLCVWYYKGVIDGILEKNQKGDFKSRMRTVCHKGKNSTH